MASDIERIMNGYKNAQDAAEYGEAVVIEEEQIEGDDYRLVWTENYSGDYPPVK